MRQLLLHVLTSALLGAIIGAVGLFILSEALPEGALAGAIIGASVGALLGARIHAHRFVIAAARRDPAEAARQPRLRDARDHASAASMQRNQLRDTIDRALIDNNLGDR